MIVKMSDCRQCGACMDGARAFSDRYGLDWVDFLVNGIDTDRLLETGDLLAIDLVRKLEERK